METSCISASVGINHSFQIRTEFPQRSCQAPYHLRSTGQSKLEETNQSPCPRGLESTDFRPINYAFG